VRSTLSYFFLPLRRWRGALAALTLILPATLAGCSRSPAPSPLLPGAAGAGGAKVHDAQLSFDYTTLDDQDDPDFNELTGINNLGKLVGFDGRGGHSDPNHGYYVTEPYAQYNFHNENYPSAVETQVRALNNTKAMAGFYLSKTGGIFGFIESHDIWTSYRDVKLRQGKSNITELLGLSDAGLAVGFYQDDKGIQHGFELNSETGKFHSVGPSNAVNDVASGINGKGDICGWATLADGKTVAWMLKGGTYTEYSYPGSANTQATAVNWQDQIVGSFVDSSGNTHGFFLSYPLTKKVWEQVDDPYAVGTSAVTSIENHKIMVGYYDDSNGNRHGFMATPK